MVAPYQDRWAQLLGSGNGDDTWAFWSWVAEETLLALCEPGLEEADLDGQRPLPVAKEDVFRGTGTSKMVREARLCPQQHRATGAPLVCLLARIQAARGALRTLQRRAATAGRGVGHRPRELQRSLDSVVTRLRRLRDLGEGYTDYSLLGAPRLLPPQDAMESLQARLRVREQTVLRQQDRQRLQSWREWLDDA